MDIDTSIYSSMPMVYSGRHACEIIITEISFDGLLFQVKFSCNEISVAYMEWESELFFAISIFLSWDFSFFKVLISYYWSLFEDVEVMQRIYDYYYQYYHKQFYYCYCSNCGSMRSSRCYYLKHLASCRYRVSPSHTVCWFTMLFA